MRVRAAALLPLVAAAALAQPLPPEWAGWRWWRPVTPPAGESPRLLGAELPPDVYERAAPDLRDLRVVDAAGAEVPHLLEVRRGGRVRDEVPAAVEWSSVPGRYTQALVDVGDGDRLHDRVELVPGDPGPELFARVDVAVRDDAGDPWRMLAEDRPVYRFAGRPAELAVTYPPTRARWLRLWLRPEPGRAIERGAVRDLRVTHETDEAPELVEIPAHRRDSVPPGPGESRWELDLGSARVPVSQLRFQLAAPQVDRAVTISWSEDGDSWTRAGTGRLRRTAASPVDPITVDFPEAAGRYWRITIHDGDDPPLPEVELGLWGVPRRIVFAAATPGPFRLLYGNDRARPPQYELGLLLADEDIRAAGRTGLGPEQQNPGWVDPRPWSERHPAVLWLSLSLAVAVLGWSAWRTLRPSGSGPAAGA